MIFIFFFQAEDGIRDLYVTGVQTCALPILANLEKKWKISDKINPKEVSKLQKELNVDHIIATLLCQRGIKDRKSTRLNSSHVEISYAVFCLKKKNNKIRDI